MIIIPEDVLRIAEALSAPIDELGLSVRSYNGLMRWGITTVADVYRAYQDKQLPRIRNLGEKSVIEIEKHLEEHLAKVAPANTSEIPNSSDCISRQAAIEALDEYFERIGKLKRRGLNKGEKAISLDTVGAIKSLPPAQPVIVPCNYVNACTEATIDKPISAYTYLSVLADLKEHGYVLVDMRGATK